METREEGIVGYLPEAVGFSLGGTEEDEALDSDGSDEEEDSTMEWNAKVLEEDSLNDSGNP